MSSNKVNNKLDFRNVKQTQLDSAQTLKGSFSELQSALRTYGTNAILKDAYTDIIQIINAQGEPTQVEYWQATSSSQDKLQFRADVAGDLAGTYFTIQEYSSKRTHAFYFVVSGIGNPPGIADVETPIILENNDTAAIVTYSTKLVLDPIEAIIVVQKSLLSSFLVLEYNQFGGESLIDVGTSGFTTTNLEKGQSFKVGEIVLDYDANGNPIHNGNTLKGMKYNIYTASFDVDSNPEELPETLIFDQNTANIMYLGVAEYGALTSESLWKIQRIDTSTGVEIRNASTAYNQVWDDREILSYE